MLKVKSAKKFAQNKEANMRKYLLIPGPTPLPKRIIQSMTKDMISHRGEEYGKIFGSILSHMKEVLGTTSKILLFPSSGTGGLEASIVNLFSPQEKLLSLSCGHFGDRFLEIAKRYNLSVDRLDTPWGKTPDPDMLYDKLKNDKDIRAILVTHNETSTGVMVDLEKIGEVMRSFPDVLFIVDGVSSVGAMPVRQDKNGIDVVVTASQKALMTPPGLSLVSVSDKALSRMKTSKLPRYYFDFDLVLSYQERNIPQNPYTPPVSLVYGLAEALKIIEEEGLENRFKRHKIMRDVARGGLKEIGLELVAQDEDASYTVTAAFVSEGEDKRILSILKEKYGIIISKGQGKFSGKVIRIGHMGETTYSDLFWFISSMERIVGVKPGVGVMKAQEILFEEDKNV